jgi:hypothetical protein
MDPSEVGIDGSRDELSPQAPAFTMVGAERCLQGITRPDVPELYRAPE